MFRDCEKDEEITRDYLEGMEAQDDQNRESLKNIWKEVDMTDEDWHQVEPDEEYFLVSSKSFDFSLLISKELYIQLHLLFYLMSCLFSVR